MYVWQVKLAIANNIILKQFSNWMHMLYRRYLGCNYLLIMRHRGRVDPLLIYWTGSWLVQPDIYFFLIQKYPPN